MSRLRIFTILLAIFATVVTFTACGSSDSSSDGGSSDSGGSTENPQTVLNQAFSPDAAIKSADLDLTFGFKSEGSESADLTASLKGPIDGTDSTAPKFDLTAEVSGSGAGQDLNFEGGATSTGDAFFITYGGDSYELDSQTAGYLKQAFAAGSAQQSQQGGSLKQFEDVLTNLTNEGTEDVDGTETVKISGDVDVQKLVDAIRPLAAQAQSLGAAAPGNIPSPAELDQVTQLIKSATFDVYAGADDHILRKLTATIDLDDPASDDTATIDFDITLGSVNESQDISAPSDAKPLSDLVGPGGLSGLLGASGLGATSSGGSAGTAAVPGLTEQQTQCLAGATTAEEYSACIQ